MTTPTPTPQEQSEMTNETEPTRTCSICGGEIEIVLGWAAGHNAQPINDGRCCGNCNYRIVLPRRVRDLSLAAVPEQIKEIMVSLLEGEK